MMLWLKVKIHERAHCLPINEQCSWSCMQQSRQSSTGHLLQMLQRDETHVYCGLESISLRENTLVGDSRLRARNSAGHRRFHGSVDIQTGAIPRIERTPRILGVHDHGFHGKDDSLWWPLDAFCQTALKK